MKSVINVIDEINTINNTITELNTNNNEKTELNVKTKLDILDHLVTVAARECQTQTKLILAPNSGITKNIPAMKSVINEFDEINTITESNTINNEITELNMKTKFDILDRPITVMSSDKARYSKITNGLLQSIVKYGACQPFEKYMTNNTFPVHPKTKRHFSSSYYFIKISMNEITKYHWMSYSIIQNVLYCHPCWLFGDNATKQSIWVSGYSDWKHLTQSAIIHCNRKQHFRSDVGSASSVF